MKLYDQGEPYEVPVNAGHTLHLCRCGLTRTPPFCDGAHRLTGGRHEPLVFCTIEASTLRLCGCGRSREMPFCDDSHP